MTPNPGFDPDIGARTAKGWSRFIGRRRRSHDLNTPGGGEVTLGAGARSDVSRSTTPWAPAADPPSGAPEDIKKGERDSPIVDS